MTKEQAQQLIVSSLAKDNDGVIEDFEWHESSTYLETRNWELKIAGNSGGAFVASFDELPDISLRAVNRFTTKTHDYFWLLRAWKYK